MLRSRVACSTVLWRDEKRVPKWCASPLKAGCSSLTTSYARESFSLKGKTVSEEAAFRINEHEEAR